MKGSRAPFALLFVAAACLTLAYSAGGPAGYRPVPFPRADAVTMPLKGHNGDGTGGYCVGIIGREALGFIDVADHVLDPLVRNRLNHQNAKTYGWQTLSTDPGVILMEYQASVQNAFKILALQSGDPVLIEASNRTVAIGELGNMQIQLEGEKSPTPPSTTCMKSSCYAQPSTCRVSGCSAGCADCVGISVPSIN